MLPMSKDLSKQYSNKKIKKKIFEIKTKNITKKHRIKFVMFQAVFHSIQTKYFCFQTKIITRKQVFRQIRIKKVHFQSKNNIFQSLNDSFNLQTKFGKHFFLRQTITDIQTNFYFDTQHHLISLFLEVSYHATNFY